MIAGGEVNFSFMSVRHPPDSTVANIRNSQRVQVLPHDGGALLADIEAPPEIGPFNPFGTGD